MTALIPLGLIWLAGYLALCLISPFATCRRCRRYGHMHPRKRPRCRVCENTGLRQRWGRRLIAEIRRAHDRADNGRR